jgi:hypothetical protein
MDTAPAEISGLPVVCWSPIDGRHSPTGRCRHLCPQGLFGPAAGVAVCGRPEEGFYLFGCDANWRPVTDTWHETAEEARRQAEFEYEGVSATWRYNG